MLENILIIVLALGIDLAVGEYPDRFHPVAWMGSLATLLLKGAPKKGPSLQFIYGVAIVIFSAAVFAAPAFFLMNFLHNVSLIAFIIVGALLLKSTFSVRVLYRLAMNVKTLLLSRKLNEARKQTGYLVSRNTDKLSRGEVTSAVLEMVSESVTDSVVAPMFFFLIFGVPGALAYRMFNTWDSRIGYHDEFEYLGKFAARLDDVLNYIPARLAALLLVLSAFVLRMNGRKAWTSMLRFHKKTSSPNAGWTMSAAAGALNTRLEKPGHYRLGDAEDFPEPSLIPTGLRLVMLSCLIWFAVSIAVVGVRYAITG